MNDEEMRWWRGRRVMVTGGAGFIGSALVRALLDRGAAVVVTEREEEGAGPEWRGALRATGIRADVESFDAMLRIVNEHDVDTVFHLAAQTEVGAARRSPLSTFRTNMMGTVNVLEAARQCSTVKRVIVASSDKAYGDVPELPYVEDIPLAAVHPYDVSKACADTIARGYHRSYGLPVCVTRCANVYGPGHRNWTTIIPGTIRSVACGERPLIRSDGTPVRDFLFIDDCVSGYLTLARGMDDPSVHGKAFNISAESPLSVLDVVNRIRAAMGRLDLEPDVRAEAQGEIQAQHLSAARARELLGWRAAHSFEQGLASTIPWYLDWLERGG